MGLEGRRVHDRGPAESAESSSARWCAGLLAAFALASCAQPPRPAPDLPGSPATRATGRCYRLDPAQSELRVLVYRAGPLARLGHNHVLLAGDLAGELCAGRFSITVPVAGLVVDPAAARAEEGAEFATEPSAADVEGTRRHLLGDGQLEASVWPTIRIGGLMPSALGDVVATTRLEVRGAATVLEVPVHLGLDGDGRLLAAGGFELAQTSLGLVPYSVALGALHVRDEVSIRFRLVAVQDRKPSVAE